MEDREKLKKAASSQLRSAMGKFLKMSVSFFLQVLAIMFLWNYAVPDVMEINYIKALALALVIRLATHNVYFMSSNALQENKKKNNN